MDQNQTTAPPNYVPPPVTVTSTGPGVFGTKIPSVVAFGMGVLLFFLPFIDIKCNGTSLQQVNGIQLATGFQMKNSSSDNPFLNDEKTDVSDKSITKESAKTDKKDPNPYAMVALGLGVIGLLLAFTNSRAAVGGGIVAGVAAAGAMIGLMIDIKKKIKLDMPGTDSKTTGEDDPLGLNKLGSEVSDKLNITVDFTPWFYIAMLAFLAAAYFSYRRMKALPG